MLTGSTNSLTPFDSNTWSPAPPPPSTIKPYWKPEQPPPCTNTRRPLPVLPSSVSSSLIFDAAVWDTLIMVSILLGKSPVDYMRPHRHRQARVFSRNPLPEYQLSQCSEFRG